MLPSEVPARRRRLVGERGWRGLQACAQNCAPELRAAAPSAEIERATILPESAVSPSISQLRSCPASILRWPSPQPQ